MQINPFFSLLVRTSASKHKTLLTFALSRLNFNIVDRNSILMLRWEKFQMKICNLLALKKVLFLAVKIVSSFKPKLFPSFFGFETFLFFFLLSFLDATKKTIIQRSGLTFFSAFKLNKNFRLSHFAF